MIVKIGIQFAKEILNYPIEDKKKILAFIKHTQQNGLRELEGRNKSSDDVDKDDPFFPTKVKFAQQHKLWHYHIGVVEYDLSKPFGDRTSEYVLHYINQLVPDELKVVDFSGHPPFKMPLSSYLN
ncbi:hypothetical protein [Xenorhabdus kozodoii]|uniref:Uncharacterized protein n=1 Tax=Xenorhabdus kozodoii TaxID=351676 RepID=A0A2D0L4R4_9GAMM|nr:hypothetical protein [Xenorhabdus kozodoii]PHM70397.1 hypothetical protein Xkoz_03108 [Xenorhabdus kozodoii]